MARSGKIWHDLARWDKGDMARSGKIGQGGTWQDLARSGKIWQDLATRGKMGQGGHGKIW